MILTCKCLNVSINTGSNPIEPKPLDLSESERIDPFFVKNPKLVLVENILKCQDSLVTVHNIGLWVLHKCLNCKLDVYASRKQEIVVSPDLLSDPVQIKELRQSPSFSSVFNIVLQPNNISCDPLSRPNTRPSSDSDPLVKSTRLASLNQQVSSYLQKLSANVEEKIRQFSEEQYTLLEKERTKVQTEHRSLVKVVHDSSNSSNNDSPLVFTPYQIISPLHGASKYTKGVSKPAPVGSNGSARNSSDASDDFMFELEDVEDPVNNGTLMAGSEDETSDTDDSGSHDEGIHIPRGKQQDDCVIAKSLPMVIPAFNNAMNNGREMRTVPKKKTGDDYRETQDIAASIKALARSVHGDTPFGDLPRPRLGSHI